MHLRSHELVRNLSHVLGPDLAMGISLLAMAVPVLVGSWAVLLPGVVALQVIVQLERDNLLLMLLVVIVQLETAEEIVQLETAGERQSSPYVSDCSAGERQFFKMTRMFLVWVDANKSEHVHQISIMFRVCLNSYILSV